NSFKKINNQAIGYAVNYGSNQKLIFTIQVKPSDDEISDFYKDSIPLHINVDTSVGKAAIGVANNQTIVSLPTKDQSWVLIAAPTDVNQDQLKQVANSIRKSN